MKSKLNLTNKSIFLFALIFLFSTNFINGQSGQYKENTEIGSFGGISYYLGDLNNSHFNNSIPNFGLMVRKNIDRRISYKGTFMLVNIAADDRNSSDEFASQRGLHFSNNMFEENGSSIYELSGQFEFNFLPYELEIHYINGLHLYILDFHYLILIQKQKIKMVNGLAYNL